MPWFLAGSGMARGLSAVTGAPFVSFSHQQGHVAAALYGADKTAWLDRRFLAFHVSGGTTDALLVEPDGDTVLRCETVATSLDLKAGQLIDRTGVLLGLPNYFTSHFLLKALSEVPAVVVYPTRGVASIALIALAGVLLFKERLSMRQWISIFAIAAALVLLNL